MTVKTATLKKILDAFNRHDLDSIMEFFAEDCSFDSREDPSPADKGRSAKPRLEKHFQEDSKASPVHYGQDSHWVSGNKGLSEWTLTGTTITGLLPEVRGCDLWEFENDKVKRKDSYWKIVERNWAHNFQKAGF